MDSEDEDDWGHFSFEDGDAPPPVSFEVRRGPAAVAAVPYLHIGDSVENDVAAPTSLGWEAVLLARGSGAPPSRLPRRATRVATLREAFEAAFPGAAFG